MKVRKAEFLPLRFPKRSPSTARPLARRCFALLFAAAAWYSTALASPMQASATEPGIRGSDLASAAFHDRVFQTILSVHGKGSHTTQSVAVPHEWQLFWKYDCTKAGAARSFSVSIRPDDGQSSPFEPVTQRGRRGHNTEFYHQAGTFYMVVHTSCAWALRVQVNAPAPAAPPTATDTPIPTPTTAPTDTPIPAPTNTPAPTATPEPVVLLTMTGSGAQSTPLFTVYGTEWQIQWSYDCSLQSGRGNFIVNIFTSDGGYVIGGVNELGTSGSRTEYMHQGGTFYLDINSTCSWAVKVVANDGGTPASAPTGSLLLSVQGSGQQTTQLFTTHGNEWQIHWQYNCASFGSRGNFMVDVYSQDGTLSDVAVNELGISGARTDYLHQGGTFYLQIGSECDWQVQVTG